MKNSALMIEIGWQRCQHKKMAVRKGLELFNYKQNN